MELQATQENKERAKRSEKGIYSYIGKFDSFIEDQMTRRSKKSEKVKVASYMAQ
jgi:hypothetical protein